VNAYTFPCLVLALALALPAARQAQAEELTLREAESLALENHARVRLAEQDVAQAQAEVARARGRMLPSLSASAGYNRNIERPVFFAPAPLGRIEVGEENEHSMTLSATQPLFLGFAGITGYRAAKTGREQAELGARQAEQELLFQVRQAYLGAAMAREIVRVQEEAVAQAESSLVQVQRRHEVGSASGFELLQAQVQLANTRPGLVAAHSDRRLADAQLRNAIGLEAPAKAEPAEGLAPFASRWLGVPLDSLIAVASRQRPELLQLRLQQRAAEHGVDLARSAYFPSVLLTGRMTWQGQSEEMIPEEFARSMAAGVQLSWTLWDSWQSQAAVRKARVAVRQAELAADLTRDGIELEIEAAGERLGEADATLAAQATTVDQAKEALRLARVRYDNGSSTQLDVINAQFVLTQTQTAYARSVYEYHMAHAQLERALGLIGRQ